MQHQKKVKPLLVCSLRHCVTYPQDTTLSAKGFPFGTIEAFRIEASCLSTPMLSTLQHLSHCCRRSTNSASCNILLSSSKKAFAWRAYDVCFRGDEGLGVNKCTTCLSLKSQGWRVGGQMVWHVYEFQMCVRAENNCIGACSVSANCCMQTISHQDIFPCCKLRKILITITLREKAASKQQLRAASKL